MYDDDAILLEYDRANTLLATYSHGEEVDQPLAMARGAESFFYHTDHLGSVRLLTDGAGAGANAYDYDSFGNLETEVNGSITRYVYDGDAATTGPISPMNRVPNPPLTGTTSMHSARQIVRIVIFAALAFAVNTVIVAVSYVVSKAVTSSGDRIATEVVFLGVGVGLLLAIGLIFLRVPGVKQLRNSPARREQPDVIEMDILSLVRVATMTVLALAVWVMATGALPTFVIKAASAAAGVLVDQQLLDIGLALILGISTAQAFWIRRLI